MYVKAVRLLNWMAFAGEHVLNPLPAGPIAVVGRYAENGRRSNWSGKTALLEAIRFALTGSHRKRLDDSLITHGQDGLDVQVVLVGGERRVTVSRTRPRGGPTVLRVLDGEQLFERDAAEEHLARILRLPVDDFDNTSWFGQGDVQALVAKTSGVRREVFSRWLELDLWERMGKRAMTGARAARTALETARRAENGPPPRAAEERTAEREQLESERLHLEADLDQLEHELARNAEASALLATLTARRADAETAARALSSVRDQLLALPPAIPEERVAELEEAQAAARSAQDAAEREVGDVRRLLAGRFDGKCPVTCEECPVSEEVSGKRAAFVERSRVAGAARDAATRAKEEADVELRSCRDTERERVRLVGAMNEASKRARATRSALEEVSVKVDPEQIREAEELRRANQVARERMRARLREIDAALGRLGEEARHAELFAVRETKRFAALEQAERDARIAQLVARALGSSGIPARIAAASLSGLEARANALLAGLGLSFTLTWERELADPAPACGECGYVYEKRSRAKECPGCGVPRGRRKSDELDVLVEDGSGEVEDVRAKSGGAKVLVASAIRLAGGMLLRERRGSPLEVAFVDEPFGELDLENRDALARTFAGLLSSVGLEQAFVVSHDAQLLAGLPARIVVTREGSTSRLELEA